jgi:hypothetical protein
VSQARSPIAEVLRPIPPQIGPARTRRIPSGVEVIGSEKNIRIRLPKGFTAYDFLKKVIGHSRVDLHTRIAAAVACLPYERPRLIGLVANNTGGVQRIEVTGGLPRLPGSTTIFPQGQEPLPYVPPPRELGTCTEGAAGPSPEPRQPCTIVSAGQA